MKNFKKNLLLAFVMVFICVLAACNGQEDGAAQAAEDEEVVSSDGINRSGWPESVRFAVADIEGMEELQRRFGAFQEVMEDLMGIDFEFFSVTNRIISATAMEYDQVDIVLAGPSEYAKVKSANPDAEPLVGIERDLYHTVIIVPEDSDITELDDLKGKTIAMGAMGSTSRHIGPSALLIENGFDLDRDIETLLLGDARFEAFRAGDVDALAGGIRDYLKMVEESGEGVYRLLVEGPPLPQDPFVANPNLPESFREELSRVLYEYQDEILEAILSEEDNNKYLNARIVEVTDADFDLMRETYRILGIEL